MNEPIKILQFLSEAHFGGTERSVYALIASMNSEFFANDVCFLLDRGPMGDQCEADGFRVSYLHWRFWKTPLLLFILYGLLRRGRYQIVHAYGFKANLMARIIGRLAGVPQVVGGLRSQYPSLKKKRWLFWLDRLTLSLTRYYVANSQAAVDYLVSQGYPKEKFLVIHGGIDTACFTSSDSDRRSLRARQGLSGEGMPVIVCVARFRPGKGQETLLAALTRLAKQEFHCLLVGDGPTRRSMEDLARELGLSGRLQFLGVRDHQEIAVILRMSDLFVLPSRWEGMPTAIMEAMAAGLPVIATDVGGTRELVLDGETGILVAPGDAEGLANQIAFLLGDPELRRQMGTRGRERISREFALEKMIAAYEALYAELAKG